MIYLVRHGETVWNASGRRQGHLDSPLTQSGIDQARSAGQTLLSLLPDNSQVRVETSPLGRARRTAVIICAEIGIREQNVIISPLLIEHNLGDWQGLTWDEIEQQFPGTGSARKADKWNFRVPGGESYASVADRARQWLQTQNDAEVTIAVTHAMLSRNIQGAYAQLTPDETTARDHPHNRIYRLHQGKIEEIRVKG